MYIMLPGAIKFICGLTLRIWCPNTLSFNEIRPEYINGMSNDA